MSKFYNFISTNKKHELYVYGEIIGGSCKWEDSDVIFDDFKNKLNEIGDNSILDIYINSPGGSVITTQGIVAALRRAKDRGVTINAYIDGIGASCASWMPFVADNVYIYPQSIMMIHKPMSIAFGNADQMKKEIDVLNKIENDVIIPLYMEKAKEGVTKEFIKKKMAEETWFTANEINELFNVIMLSDEKQIACCVDKNVLNRYKNVPQELLKQSEVVNMDSTEKVKSTEEDLTIKRTIQETKVIEETIESGYKKDENEQMTSENNQIENDSMNENNDNLDDLGNENYVNDESKKDTKIKELEAYIKTLLEEKAELEKQLEKTNEKVIALNDKVEEMKPIVEEYNNKLVQEEKDRNDKLLDEKRKYYKNKFEQLGARSKFESEEVQNLISNCIKDEKSISKLNLMIVDMINIENSKPKEKYENVTEMDNLLDIEESVTSKYGFR